MLAMLRSRLSFSATNAGVSCLAGLMTQNLGCHGDAMTVLDNGLFSLTSTSTVQMW
jgi:hypothetical protein